jgi:GNAT superfamily N-acetyltransferase
MAIRPATADDIPTMHRIRLSVRENRLGSLAAIGAADYRPFLGEMGDSFVVEEAGEIAGFGVLDASLANVWALFVLPGFERRGVGRALHDALLGAAAARRIARLWLTTDAGTRAAGFYGKLGWSAVGRTEAGELRFERAVPGWEQSP